MGQRTKWGNCSRFKTFVQLAAHHGSRLRPRYLVTHEAVHLAVPDHSQRFWLTVQSLCPDMERARQWLSDIATNYLLIYTSPAPGAKICEYLAFAGRRDRRPYDSELRSGLNNAESGKRDYPAPLLSEPDVKVSLHPAQASRRPCERPVSSLTTCWLYDTEPKSMPLWEGSTSGTKPPTFATPSLPIPLLFSYRDTAGKSARFRAG